MSDLDNQALTWAQSNPTDPRSQDVMAKAWAGQNPNDPRAAAVLQKATKTGASLGAAAGGPAPSPVDPKTAQLDEIRNASKDEDALGPVVAGAERTMTGGYLPTIQAAGQKAYNVVTGGPNPSMDELTKAYEDYAAGIKKQAPLRYGAGKIAGYVVPGTVAAKGLGAVGLLPEVTGAGTGALAGAETQGLIGAAENPKNEEGQTTPRLQNAGINAAGGAIGGGVFGSLAKYFNPTNQAIKAFDPKGNALKGAISGKSGMSVTRLGETAYDEGLLGAIPKDKQALYEATQEAFEKRGKDIGALVSQASDGTAITIDKNAALVGIQKSAEFLKDRANGSEYYDQAVNKVSDMLNNYGDKITPLRAHEIKVNLGKVIPWNKPTSDYSPSDLANRFMYHAMQDGLEGSVDLAAKTGQLAPDSMATYTNLKGKYQDLKLLSEISAKSAQRELNNRTFSLTDYIAAAEGLSKFGPGGLLLGAANKAARTYGPGVGGYLSRTAGPQIGAVARPMLTGGAASAAKPVIQGLIPQNQTGESQNGR